ncbi:MAG: hypothetical protein V1899_04770 [Planctomycetota bacterium]
MRILRTSRLACVLGLWLLPLGVAAANKPHDTVLAVSELTDEDKIAISRLFDQLAQRFLARDAKGCEELVSQTAENRQRIIANLVNEFAQSSYLEFKIIDIQPDDTIKEKKQHSVDVRISYKIQKSAPDKGDIENTVCRTFLLQQLNGRFFFVSSSFFDGLGLRHGVWGWVRQGLLALLAGVALLTFWIWMGWEVYRSRPRRIVWRLIVLIPFIGTLAYFMAVYLPSIFRKTRNF